MLQKRGRGVKKKKKLAWFFPLPCKCKVYGWEEEEIARWEITVRAPRRFLWYLPRASELRNWRREIVQRRIFGGRLVEEGGGSRGCKFTIFFILAGEWANLAVIMASFFFLSREWMAGDERMSYFLGGAESAEKSSVAENNFHFFLEDLNQKDKN